ILKYLGMENAVFDVRISCDVTENLNSPSAIIGGKCISAHHSGVDKVEFFISANKGEIPKPLKDTASGGEISRVMLSIKSIVAEHRAMPMLVFDEIDSGISGKVARKTGLVMKDLAAHHQILAITHLPQIAALGDNNLFVSKRDDDERTTTTVAKLDTEAKIKSIAQMISGEDISDAALESARTLIDSDTH
ncbi:MAG: DNA repair protein RecN, partial [Candidatus Kapabacteria bacterium]|nr:DNA repair protein RecN [Candidatus Kapabacteria bacterium]